MRSTSVGRKAVAHLIGALVIGISRYGSGKTYDYANSKRHKQYFVLHKQYFSS